MSLFGRAEAESLRADLRRATEALDQCLREVDRLVDAIDAMPSRLVLFDAEGRIVRRSPALAIGGHEGVLLDEAVERLGRDVAENGAVDRRLEMFGPPQRVFRLRGIPLSVGGCIAVIDEISDSVRLDAVRTDFVANISHELKTPVAGLAVLAEAIADLDDLDVIRGLAGRMVDEAHRASSTIDDLLELSQIEIGGLLDTEAVDIGEVITEAVSRINRVAERRGVRIVVAGAVRCDVNGDKRQLVSAVANLIDNAVKYSPVDSDVCVTAVRSAGYVDIEIADHGIGIPAKDIDRIFERFYRVDRARSRDTGGTGLGLAIVRHVAGNHGGDVLVQSREGEGSTFTLRLTTAGY